MAASFTVFAIFASNHGSRVCFKIFVACPPERNSASLCVCVDYNGEQFCAEHKPLTVVSVAFASLSSPAGCSFHDREFILCVAFFSAWRHERPRDPVPERT